MENKEIVAATLTSIVFSKLDADSFTGTKMRSKEGKQEILSIEVFKVYKSFLNKLDNQSDTQK